MLNCNGYYYLNYKDGSQYTYIFMFKDLGEGIVDWKRIRKYLVILKMQINDPTIQMGHLKAVHNVTSPITMDHLPPMFAATTLNFIPDPWQEGSGTFEFKKKDESNREVKNIFLWELVDKVSYLTYTISHSDDNGSIKKQTIFSMKKVEFEPFDPLLS